MSEDLLTTEDIAELYRCSYRTGDGDPSHQVVRPGAERAYALPSKGIGG